MIRYSLKCAQGHGFESWFQSATAYDTLAQAGHVECPVCGDGSISKALMAPKIGKSADRAEPVDTPASHDPASEPVTVPAPDTPEMPQKLREAIETLRQEVEKNSDYVGRSFAKEARDMHDGVTPERAIHGVANAEEARALVQDGIPILPLPFRDRRGTN